MLTDWDSTALRESVVKKIYSEMLYFVAEVIFCIENKNKVNEGRITILQPGYL